VVADFKYIRPNTLAEVFENIETEGVPQIYSGGTDLLVKMYIGSTEPNVVIDIKEIPEMTGIKEDDEYISVGAATTFSQLYSSELIQKWLPGLAQAAHCVGSGQIQRKGTLGGNICNASPAADGMTAIWALGAKIQLVSRYTTRTIPLTEFVCGPGKTTIYSGEVLCRILIPKQEWTEQNFFKVGRRNALAISVVNGCVSLQKDCQGRILAARISVGACGPTPVRAKEAEDLLVGNALTSSLIDMVIERVREELQPIDDLRASAAYRKYVACAKVKELLEQAEGG